MWYGYVYSRTLNEVYSSLAPPPLQEIASTGGFLLHFFMVSEMLTVDQKEKMNLSVFLYVLIVQVQYFS